jgi:fructose-1,6-bisphosphatase I
MNMPPLSLSEWLRHHAVASLASVITDLAIASNEIATLIRGGALSGSLGALEATNVQGETQKQLDVLANDICKQHLRRNSHVRAIASEEEDHAVDVGNENADYLVAFDPLDGSSNIDVNVTVGTIFSVLPAPAGEAGDAAFLQPGHRQLAAGYFAYGPQVTLVLALAEEVAQFSADPSTGLYFLTHKRLSLPPGTRSIAANVSNLSRWAPQLAERVSQLLNSGTYNMRWTGSMVADIHRILHQGGVFLYPGQSDRANGKLRLLYECNPIALILENAGGDSGETLKIQPTGLHQRIGFVSGDKDLVHSLRAE